MVRLPPTTPDYHYTPEAREEVARNVAMIRAKGVAAWNEHHATLTKPARLFGADLQQLELIGIKLARADLRAAKFAKSNLANADLEGADMRGCDLGEAHLDSANLEDANLLEARLTGAGLRNANLANTNLGDAKLNNAVLRLANLRGAFLYRTNLENSDLDGARGLALDLTCVRNARLPVFRSDDWSALRRAYTGSAMAVNLILVAVFLLPLVAEALLWVAVNRTQIAAAPVATDVNVSLCIAAQCREVPVWSLVLGLERGWLYATALSLLLIYNGLRLLLTLWLAPLRDEEERSGFSPRRWPLHAKPYRPVDPPPTAGRWLSLLSRTRASYGWMIPLHKAMRVLFLVALLMFATRFWLTLTATVFLPAG